MCHKNLFLDLNMNFNVKEHNGFYEEKNYHLSLKDKHVWSVKKKIFAYNTVSQNSILFPLTVSTCFVFVILLYKETRISDRSNNSGYTCDWTSINRERTVYITPCMFHARYVSLIWYIGGTSDLCEVEIYGEYTIYTMLQTDFHPFDLCRIKWLELFFWYTIYRKKLY